MNPQSITPGNVVTIANENGAWIVVSIIEDAVAILAAAWKGEDGSYSRITDPAGNEVPRTAIIDTLAIVSTGAYRCSDCGANDLSDDAGYEHSQKYRHCVTDANGNETFCRRWDH